jgi:predicted nucleic acid-binding protein
MTLAEMPDAATVFIDANVFVYHFTGVSPECKGLLERAERTSIRGVTGAHILLEVLHRLMMIEAVTKGLISPSQPAKKLKQNWQVIQQLKDYNHCVSEIAVLNVAVLPITEEVIRESEELRQAHGLMTNDSITFSLMTRHGLTNLATLDSDLRRVPGLALYQPSDVP